MLSTLLVRISLMGAKVHRRAKLQLAAMQVHPESVRPLERLAKLYPLQRKPGDAIPISTSAVTTEQTS